MRVLILHGILGRAGENWGQWLHDELMSRNYQVIMPTLPQAGHPDRAEWLETIQQYANGNTEDLIIVGHSLGVTSALDFIEQSSTQIKSLVSVSGFAVDYGMELNSYFLKERTIDFTKVRNHLGQALVFFGDNDPYVPQEALQALATELDIVPTIIHGGGHLNAAAGFGPFPQLLETIMSMKDE